MSGIRNPQRRALEALMKDRPAKEMRVGGRTYYVDGKRAFLLGVSKGIGTSSDLYGVNIAGFSLDGPSRGFVRVESTYSSAALLRHPFAGECPDDNIARMVVEELALEREALDAIFFVRTGRKEIYVNTIC